MFRPCNYEGTADSIITPGRKLGELGQTTQQIHGVMFTPLQQGLNDSPLSHLPTRYPWRPRQQAWSDGEDGFLSPTSTLLEQPVLGGPTNVCRLPSWPHNSQRKCLLSTGAHSTEIQPPELNRKGGELCKVGSSGWLS